MLTIYGNAWHQRSAGQYYRVRVPLTALNKIGAARCWIDDPFEDQSMREQNMWGCNAQVHFLTAGKGIHTVAQRTRELVPAMNGEGQLQYPPVIVFDMDDDIESINPLNPKFCTLGTRDGAGNLLEPRSDLGILMDDGSPEPLYLWRHGLLTSTGVFDSGRNIISHAQVRKMAATAHAITCTTPALAETARKWNPNVYIYPNSLLFDDFHQFDIRRRPDEVRVLWQGGYSHFSDFYPLRHGIKEAATRCRNVKWVVFGTLFNCVYDCIPQPLVEFHPWVAFELFHMKLGTLAFDINIAPLADTPFNRAKSGIKWYEAAALKVPTLAQNAGPYREEIVDGENGLLFSTPEEFVEKLERLVKDAGYRRIIGERAYDWVRAYRDATKNVLPLAEFYRTLVKQERGYDIAA